MMSLTRSHVLGAFVLLAVLAAGAPALAGDIHQAIAEDDAGRVAELLRDNPSLTSQADDGPAGDLPLHVAAALGRLDIARLLIDAGADVNGGDVDESTPLDVAAIRRQPEMVNLLLKHGADLNHRDRNGACAISFAAFGGDSTIIRQLIDAGADLNYRSHNGTTLVHAAAMRGQGWLLDLLFARGQDPSVTNNAGESALVWAARGGQPEIMERLLAAGAAVDRPDTSGITPLAVAIMFRSPEAARVLLNHGADPNRADERGNTPLIMASWGEEPALVTLLTERGADPNAANEEGGRPLWSAMLDGNLEMVTALLEAGADPNAVDPHYGRTALHVAAVGGFRDIADLLLDHGASPDARDAGGHTPLWLATHYDNDGVARPLREPGADAVEALPPRGPAGPGELAEGEARVWYLGHSGWGIQTAGHFLVFDYHELGRPSDDPALANGSIFPREVAGQQVTVFVSHEHQDHFNPLILGWRDEIPDLTYVFGFRPEESQRSGLPEEFPAYEYVAPRETRDIAGIKVTAIESNDSGEGFLVEVDGVSILHPGDHANRRRDFSGPYRAEIDFLAAAGARPDIAFFPISGCGFGDLEAVKLGVYYALDTLTPKLFLPMHGGNQGSRYPEFIEGCGDRFPHTQLEALEFKGDCLHYKDGRAS